MRLASLAALLTIAACSGGCLVGSFQPFYDDTSIEFDDGLVGEWESAEDKTLIRVDRAEWKAYKVSYPAKT